MLVGLDLTGQVGELKQWSDPHIRAIVRGEPFKAESETADLWQPKWNENQTVFAVAKTSIPWTEMLIPWKVQGLGARV